jgi:hypothetical protein
MIGAGYLLAAVKRTPRPVSAAAIKFYRGEQMARMRALVSRIVKPRRKSPLTTAS